MSAARLRRGVAAAVAVLALAGCGATVQLPPTTTTPGSAGAAEPGLSLSSPPAPAGPGNTTTGGVATPGLSAGAGSGPSSGGGGATHAPSGGAGTASAAGAGPVRSVVRVGVIYIGGLAGATAALGGSAATTDSKSDYAAVFNYLNKHRGHGPKLTPYYFAINASSSQPAAVQLQSACDHFTSDQRVDIVLTYTLDSGNVLSSCLAKKGTPLVDGYSEAGTGSATFAANPNLWAPAQITFDRLGKLLPTYLIGARWASSRWGNSCPTVRQPRIGVVTFDRPEYRAAYTHDLVPTFKALGDPVYDAVFLSVSGSSTQQVAQVSAAVGSAVLKFSSECIDHVVMMSQVAVDYLFMDVASSQGYSPRYGLSSLEAGPVLIPNLTNPRSQLRGAMGPGWSPYSDVLPANFDALAKQPGARCLAILKHARLAPSDNNSAILALPSCEGPFFVAAVVSHWRTSEPASALLGIVNSLGSSYHPVGAYASSFSSNQHDAAAAYRGFAFDDGCGCFRYTTGLRRM